MSLAQLGKRNLLFLSASLQYYPIYYPLKMFEIGSLCVIKVVANIGIK